MKRKIVELIHERHPKDDSILVVRGKYEDWTISENVCNMLTFTKEQFERYKAIPEPDETLYEKARKRMLKPMVNRSNEKLQELYNTLSKTSTVD